MAFPRVAIALLIIGLIVGVGIGFGGIPCFSKTKQYPKNRDLHNWSNNASFGHTCLIWYIFCEFG